MLHMPTPMLMVGQAPKTYDEFVAHITALATSGTKVWAGGAIAQTAGAYITTASTAAGIMYGSSWASFFYRPNAATARLIQHGLASPEEFTTQASAGRQIFFRISNDVADQPLFFPVNRNGYNSLPSDDGTYPAALCTQIIRWDGTQALTSNPSAGGSPTPYTW